ncbi:MAG: hypothetical protein HC817_02100 [Saprospiraceae bacterium]|nr:hypothetical protein [Saprospiraceae bacterium]
MPGSFNFPFEEIENVSIVYPDDKAFRIITWDFMVSPNEHKYYGLIQVNDSKSIVYELNDVSRTLQKPEIQMLTAQKWFGCLVYNVKQFKTDEGMKYLLFGFNAHNAAEKIKLIDVLTLRGGAPRFGSTQAFNILERGKKKRLNRLIFYHGYESSMRVNFDDEMAMIVYDHLTAAPSSNPTVPFVNVPDGTYEALKLNNGVWEHIEKLPTTVMDEAPRPKPVIGKKKVVDKDNAKQFQWPDEIQKRKKKIIRQAFR